MQPCCLFQLIGRICLAKFLVLNNIIYSYGVENWNLLKKIMLKQSALLFSKLEYVMYCSPGFGCLLTRRATNWLVHSFSEW